MRELQLPPNLKYLGDYVIDGDTLIKELVIPDSVTFLGLGNYKYLKSITFGTGLEELPYNRNYYYGMGSNNFGACKNLEEVIIKDSEKEFAMWVYVNSQYIPPFTDCDIKHYYVGRPLGETKLYKHYGNKIYYLCKQGETGHIGLLEIAGGCKEVPYFYQRIDTLVLGENVSVFDSNNICIDSLKALYCKNRFPTSLVGSHGGYYYNISNLTYVNLSVYVPKGSLAAYQSAYGWKNFWDIREYDETTGISAVKTRPQETGHNYYDLQGRKLREPQKGINIIDGKKVLVK